MHGGILLFKKRGHYVRPYNVIVFLLLASVAYVKTKRKVGRMIQFNVIKYLIIS